MVVSLIAHILQYDVLLSFFQLELEGY